MGRRGNSPRPRVSIRLYLGRVLRLTLLAPDLVEAILGERLPAGVRLPELMKPFPASWKKQRGVLGFL